MAVTIVVLSGGDAGAGPDPSITLDAPRLVLGRGEGCDVRLPDPTVSHRHASIRQRGGEHVLVDENSANGTFMDRVRLPPQTPRVLASGERVRLGRVWVEVRFEPALVKGSTAAAAKELALGLVARGLAAQGEAPEPRLSVVAGPSAGAELVLREAGRTYAIGRAASGDLVIDDPGLGRRHATVLLRGDGLVVTDCGGPGGTELDGAAVQEATWRAGQELRVGATRIAFAYPAVEALAELERSPDERMPDGEVPEPARPAARETPAAAEDSAAPADAAPVTRPREAAKAVEKGGGWGAVDAAVVVLALGVLVVSVLGAFLLLGR